MIGCRDVLCRAGGKPCNAREEKVRKIALGTGAERGERRLVGGIYLVLRGGENVFCAGQNEPPAIFIRGGRLERAEDDLVLGQEKIGVFSHDFGV